MPTTDHFVQRFHRKGRALIAGQPEPCKSLQAALDRAARIADSAAGVAVVAVTGEPEFGEYEPPEVVARYGEVPRSFP
jgi:hypothetical protein